MGDSRPFKSQWPLENHWEQSHIGRFERLLETGFLSDVQFRVVSGTSEKVYKAHTLIIATGSPVLHDVVAKTKGKSIIINNTEPEIFHMFLKFLYTGTIDDLTVDKALPLLQLAASYKVYDLHEICKSLLRADLTEEYAIKIFQQAVFYQEKQLTDKALRFICRNAWNIVDSDDFVQLKRENLRMILKNDDLLVLNEAQLIHGLIRWAKATCQNASLPSTGESLIHVLKGILELIQWDRIDPKSFVDQNSIDDFEKLFSLYVSLNPKQLVGSFRRNYFDEDNTFFTMSRLPHKFAYCTENLRRDWEIFSFKTDRSICLTSLGIPAYSQTCEDHLNVEIKIFNSDLKTTMHFQEIVPHSTKIYHVKLPRPFKIRKDTWYDVSACITGTAGYGNTGGKALTTIKCTQSDGRETIVKFEFKPLNGTIEDICRGQIDEFAFKLAEN